MIQMEDLHLPFVFNPYIPLASRNGSDGDGIFFCATGETRGGSSPSDPRGQTGAENPLDGDSSHRRCHRESDAAAAAYQKSCQENI